MKLFNKYISIGILSLLIGLTISFQMRDNSKSLVAVGIEQVEELQAELEILQVEKEVFKKQLSELEMQIKGIEVAISGENSQAQNLLRDISKYKLAAALTDVIGPGIIININPPAYLENMYYEDSSIFYQELLLSLINKLNNAGTEAISINGQRIIATTEISLDESSGNVLIYSVPITMPYEIKAIGNPDTMVSHLKVKYGFIDQMEKIYNLKIEMVKMDEVNITRFSQKNDFIFAKPINIM